MNRNPAGRDRIPHGAEFKVLQSPLSDEELGRHPLLVLYRTRGSRPREDDLL
jgi:hypothetical protein